MADRLDFEHRFPSLCGVRARPRRLRLSRRGISQLLLGGIWLLSSCSTVRELTTIRLVDEFKQENVQGVPTEVPSIVPTRWGPEGPDSLNAWKAGPGIRGLEVRTGVLVAQSTTEIPLIHVERTSGLDNDDVLHAVEVRMRVSRGANLGVIFDDSEELDFDEFIGQTKRLGTAAWPLNSPLLAGDSFQTYTLTTATSWRIPSFAASGIRHIVIRPTDTKGAKIEIESVRLIFRKEHLSNIPSGVSWQGFGDIFREVIVTRSPERIHFTVNLPAYPYLDLAVGTVEEGPVTFRVGIQADDSQSERTLLEKTVTTPHRWELAPIELENYAGGTATLSFQIEGTVEGTLGFWGSPVIRSREMMSSLGTSGGVLGDLPQGVVLIVGDTLRCDHLEAYGYSRPTAPMLARMASEGILFRDTQSQGVWTKVSVPSILTSLFPITHGIVDLTDRLPASAITIAEAFQQAGYATWASSSVAFSGQLSNLHQGVEVLHERASVLEDGSKTARPFVDRLLPWLEAHRDIPFFVFLHVFDPHSPFEPRPPYNTMWVDNQRNETFQKQLEKVRKFITDEAMRTRGLPSREELAKAGVDASTFVQFEEDWYDGSIRGMDAEIGRLMEMLEQLDLDDRTLVAFVSDHGEEFLEHGRHWHGNTVYGEMTNVPLILSWPEHLPEGVVIGETVQSIDLMPTLLELSGIPTPEILQGKSLVPLLFPEGREEAAEQLRSRPVFSERKRIPSVQTESPLDRDSFAVVAEGWKLIHNIRRPADYPEWELYEHRKDPLDLKDLAAENPDVIARLQRELERWQKSALAAKLSPQADTEGLSPDELQRLRSLGYIQ